LGGWDRAGNSQRAPSAEASDLGALPFGRRPQPPLSWNPLLNHADVFPIEVAHALARSERRGIITPAQGPMFLADILASQPQLYPYLPLLWRAYAISSQARIGVYDCLYVALAEREGCELLTADDRLVRTLQPTFPFITALASLP